METVGSGSEREGSESSLNFVFVCDVLGFCGYASICCSFDLSSELRVS